MLTYWLIKRFDPEWKIAHYMWSIRFLVLGAILSGAQMALPAFMTLLTPWQFSFASMVLYLAALGARFIKQPKIDKLRLGEKMI